MIVAKAEMALPKAQRGTKAVSFRRKKNKKRIDGDIIEFYSNTIPMSRRVDVLADQIQIVEPTVVVELQYDDIGPMYMDTLIFHYRKTDKGTFYRAVATTGGKMKKLYATPILGARIVGIRQDMSPKRSDDIHQARSTSRC